MGEYWERGRPRPQTSAKRGTALPRAPQELSVLRTLVRARRPRSQFRPASCLKRVAGARLSPGVTEAILKQKGRPSDLPFHRSLHEKLPYCHSVKFFFKTGAAGCVVFCWTVALAPGWNT